MTVSTNNINVYVSKIKMVRPEKTPKNCDFDLNLNWSIDYAKTDQKIMEYICTLSSVGEISLNFAIHGIIECKDKNIDLETKFNELSDLILDKSIDTMNNLLNETKDIKIPINAASNAQITDISQITLKRWC
ncbi:MAG: hypothetical protein A4E27_01139 [Methanobacterium sp. PtaU1.Bin242]|nr:MAG: hypothetical protein A4E27_01139 [Methanobacterium sp. PtaU1.Bin242]